MAVIASQTVLNLLFLPHYKHKDERIADAHAGMHPTAWFTLVYTCNCT